MEFYVRLDRGCNQPLQGRPHHLRGSVHLQDRSDGLDGAVQAETEERARLLAQAEGAEHHLVFILERVEARRTLLDLLIVALWYWGLPEKDCLLMIVFEGHPTDLELLALLVQDLDQLLLDSLWVKTRSWSAQNHRGATSPKLTFMCHTCSILFVTSIASQIDSSLAIVGRLSLYN